VCVSERGSGFVVTILLLELAVLYCTSE
jgi:hypothetical protein